MSYSSQNHSLLSNFYSLSMDQDKVCYIIKETNTKSLVVVDPWWDSQSIIQAIDKVKFKNLDTLYILKTHQSQKYNQGVIQLQKLYKTKIIEGKYKNTSTYTQQKQSINSFKLLQQAQTIQIGSLCISCLYTPGSTDDHVSYTITHVAPESTKIPFLFSGKSLNIGGCSQIHSIQSTTSAMIYYNNILKLTYLPSQTLLFPLQDKAVQNLSFASFIQPINEIVRAKKEAVQKAKQQQGLRFVVGSKLGEESLYNPYLRLNQKYYEQIMDNQGDIAVRFAKLRKLNDQFVQKRKNV